MRREKLSPARLEGSLVSALNATYRLEREARAPLIHRQGGMNIYKKLRNSSLTYSFSFSPVPPPPLYSRAYLRLTNLPRERKRDVQFSICIPFASRFSRFLDTVRSFSEHYEIIRLFPVSANARVQLPDLLLKRGSVSLCTIPWFFQYYWCNFFFIFLLSLWIFHCSTI